MGPKLAVALALVVSLALPSGSVPAAARAPALAGLALGLEALDSTSLKSIAAWLKASGREGYLAADVADAAGIPREAAEETLDVNQRGFRSGDVLRVAQLSNDRRRDFLLFMVQRPGGEVTFYLSSVQDGLRKAFVSLPGQNAILPLEGDDARASFQRELTFWQARVAGS